MTRTIYLIITTTLIIFITKLGYSQSTQNKGNLSELYLTMAQLDSSLFATAYTCNTSKNSSFFTEDLEFYHDKAGLLFSSRQAFLESNERKFCGEQNGFRLRRELVAGSMEVYPLSSYGAIQTGTHRFYQANKGEKEKLVEIGKFTMIWVFKNDEWRISRVISYDHQEIKEPNKKKQK